MSSKTRGLAALSLLATLPLFACGNSLDGGSSPSGSYVRVVSISPNGVTPDIFLTVCDVNTETGEITYEPGLVNEFVDVTLLNESRPNAPADAPTNRYVTMSRYRVDYVGVSRTVSIPSVNGGATVGLPPDGTGVVSVLVMGFDTLEHIRDNYPSVGNTESLTLRARITVWGEDAFRVPVSAEGEVTLVVDEYDRC